MAQDDSRLLDRIRGGEPAAFEELFTCYYTTVYRVLYGLLRAREWAEDLSQETFLELYRNPPPHLGHKEGAVSAWLYKVALNKGYNALRSNARSLQRIERAARLIEASTDGIDQDPSSQVLRDEQGKRVRHALAQLPDRQSKLLLLRYAGLSYAECADVLDTTPAAIGTLLARARDAFRAAYRAIDGEEQEEVIEGGGRTSIDPRLAERRAQ